MDLTTAEEGWAFRRKQKSPPKSILRRARTTERSRWQSEAELINRIARGPPVDFPILSVWVGIDSCLALDQWRQSDHPRHG